MTTSKKRLEKCKVDYKKKEMDNLPMNRLFFQVLDEAGNRKYPIAERIFLWKISGIDVIQDIMRQICAYIDSIRSYQRLTKKYMDELKSGKIVSKRKDGELMDRIDLESGIKANRINGYRLLADIRDLSCNQLLANITDDCFTGDMYNSYMLILSKVIRELGFDLFPKKMEIIWAE